MTDTTEIIHEQHQAIIRLKEMLTHVQKAAAPFAAHDWMDAELEDDSCQLTRHSGGVTVGHWRALRAALASTT